MLASGEKGVDSFVGDFDWASWLVWKVVFGFTHLGGDALGIADPFAGGAEIDAQEFEEDGDGGHDADEQDEGPHGFEHFEHGGRISGCLMRGFAAYC